MRIGISTASQLGIQKQGEGVYLDQLLSQLQRREAIHDYYVFMPKSHRPVFQIHASNFHVIQISDRFTSPVLNVIWYLLIYPVLLLWYRIDVVHHPEVRRIPAVKVCKTVVTVADLANFRIRGRVGLLRRAYNRFVCRVLLKSADALCVHADHTKRDLQELFSVDTSSIQVIPHGIPARFRPRSPEECEAVRGKYCLPDALIICISRLEHPQKNHVALLRAFARLKQRGLSHHLMLIGARGRGAEVVEQEIVRLNLSRTVRILGFLPEEELPIFYNVASLCVFPSLYEGFGYPILESFASGTPLVASMSSSIREVAGDGALLFDPDRDDQIERCMWDALHDEALRVRLIRAGHLRAREFSLESEAELTVALYEAVFGMNRSGWQGSAQGGVANHRVVPQLD